MHGNILGPLYGIRVISNPYLEETTVEPTRKFWLRWVSAATAVCLDPLLGVVVPTGQRVTHLPPKFFRLPDGTILTSPTGFEFLKAKLSEAS